jgi:hypothetical protein
MNLFIMPFQAGYQQDKGVIPAFFKPESSILINNLDSFSQRDNKLKRF